MSDPVDAYAARHGLDHRAQAELAELVEARMADLLDGSPTLASPEGRALPPPAGSPSLGPQDPERYEQLGLLGTGASAVVHRVLDRHLGRTLARKRLRLELLDSPIARARFERERRVPSLVRHPGIVAVFDHGRLDTGQPWFTMQEVGGKTLRADIVALHQAPRRDDWHLSLRRSLTALHAAARAVAFAHSVGVLHRDLKPENIMLGAFGEVLVLDWGLAHFDDPELEDFVPGGLLGTPGYMPPEQAGLNEHPHGPASDVYSLGAMLHELLGGRPPPRVERRIGSTLPALEGVDPALVAIAEQALALDVQARFPSASQLAEALEAWLDGTYARRRALETLGQAQALMPELQGVRGRAQRLRQEAAERLEPLAPWAAVEEKRPGWTLEDRAAEAERQAEVLGATWLQGVRAAVALDPQLQPAQSALADWYRARVLEAERLPGAPGAAAAETHLRAHHRGQQDSFLRGEGQLSLRTDPPGATVRALPLASIDRRLVPLEDKAIALGQSPLLGVALARGSWLLELEAPGRALTRVPVDLPRAGHWFKGTDPKQPEPHRLPASAPPGPESCFVPGGCFDAGGDPDAPDGGLAQRLYVPDLFMARDPVTVAEYVAFANALIESGDRAQALAVAPRAGDHPESAPLWRWSRGRIEGVVDQLGQAWPARWPVTQISWHSASAYAAWVAEQTGAPWRLPSEYEWEKAARGVDRRRWPWGHHFDPTWARSMLSTPETPTRSPVDDWPLDISVYGVRGCGGNVRDWCLDRWEAQGAAQTHGQLQLRPAEHDDPAPRAVRGGSYTSSARFCGVTARFALAPGRHYRVVGFRLCCPGSVV